MYAHALVSAKGFEGYSVRISILHRVLVIYVLARSRCSKLYMHYRLGVVCYYKPLYTKFPRYRLNPFHRGFALRARTIDLIVIRADVF